MRLLLRQAKTEIVMLLRNPGSLVFTILFPLIFLVVFSTVFGSSGWWSTPKGDVRFIGYYLPGIVTFATVSACFASMSQTLTVRRETGVLKRKRGTPLPAWALIGGVVIAESTLAMLLMVVTTGVAMAGWGLEFPRHPFAVVGTVALGAMCFSAIAIAFTAVIPNEDAAPALINAVMFPLMFISGIWFQVRTGFLSTISHAFPVARLRDSLAAAYAPSAHSCRRLRDQCITTDHVSHLAGPRLHDVMVIGGWLVGATIVAIRFFRWEPRRH